MGDREDHVTRNYLEWSDEGRPAIWRYLAAIVLGFVFWMWGSIPAILLLQDFLNDPATKSVAFEYTFVVGLVAIPLIVRYLLKRPAFSVALPAWPHASPTTVSASRSSGPPWSSCTCWPRRSVSAAGIT